MGGERIRRAITSPMLAFHVEASCLLTAAASWSPRPLASASILPASMILLNFTVEHLTAAAGRLVVICKASDRIPVTGYAHARGCAVVHGCTVSVWFVLGKLCNFV